MIRILLVIATTVGAMLYLQGDLSCSLSPGSFFRLKDRAARLVNADALPIPLHIRRDVP